MLVVVATSVFLAEGAMMWVLYRLPSFSPQTEGLLNAALLTLVVYPVLYFFLYRPMVLSFTEREQKEKELQETYDRLKKTRAQLLHSEKMSLIGQLSAGVAHEINNPVTVISGEAQILFKDEHKDQETKDALKTILEQTKRIETITRRLLEFSRREEPKQQPMDINETIEKSLTLLSYQATLEHVAIVKKLDPNLPRVLGDPNQIQEVFLNIMLNAVQAMESGGTLTIRSYCGQKSVAAEVEDTGKGMDAETLQKAFDPFFTTKEKGTGLGLSVSYGIIENHGGVIEARSELGKGATFVIKLPLGKKGGDESEKDISRR